MKKINFILGLVLLLTSQIAISQVPKKTVVEHFTNTNCSNCASRNPGFYTNLISQTNVLHLAVHPSSPYSNCQLYQQNSTANDERTNYYNIYGSTPRLVINGAVISSGVNYSNSSIFTPYQSLTTPASIRIVQEKFGTDSIRATIIIKTEAIHSLGSLSLFVALAEDTVFYTGGNGESQHYDVFRKTLSSTIGTPFTLPATVGDSVVLTFSSPTNSIWNFSRIYTLAILQETISKNLVQAEAVSPSVGAISTGINEANKQLNALIFPNPMNDVINIQLVESIASTFTITSLDGKLIMKKEVAQNNFQIDMSSFSRATYLLNIKANKGEYSQKIIKQ